MGRYLGKRLASTIPLLLVISCVVFIFIHMIQGDPARLVDGKDEQRKMWQLYVNSWDWMSHYLYSMVNI